MKNITSHFRAGLTEWFLCVSSLHSPIRRENVYRDSEVIDRSPRGEAPASALSSTSAKPLSISLRTPTKSKPNTPVKKIDLGMYTSFEFASFNLKTNSCTYSEVNVMKLSYFAIFFCIDLNKMKFIINQIKSKY